MKDLCKLLMDFYSGFAFKVFSWETIKDYSTILVGESQKGQAPVYANKRILVLGPDIRPYYYAKVATPYFNWQLCKDEIEGIAFYDNLEMIDYKVRSDMPDFIIDQENIATNIFEKIPLLGREYQSIQNGIYRRITKSN